MKKDKQFSIRISEQDLDTIRQKAAQAEAQEKPRLEEEARQAELKAELERQAAADAERIVLRVRQFHAFKAVDALFEVRPERAEHTPRPLASRAVQIAVDQRRAVVVLAVAGYDVTVHAGVG